MQDRPAPSPFACFVAGILGMFVVGLIEVATLSGKLFAGAGGATAAVQLLGLVSVIGAVIGLALAVVLPPAVRVLRPGVWIRTRLWPPTAVDEPAGALNRNAAWWIAGLVAIIPLAAVALVGGRLAHGFNQAAFAGPFTALAALAGLGLGLCALFPAYTASRWLLDRVAPSGRLAGLPTPLLPLLVIVLMKVAVVIKLGGLDLGALQLGGYAMIVVGLLVALAIVWLRHGRAPLRAGVAGFLVIALAGGTAAYAVLGLSADTVGGRVLPLSGDASRVAIASLRRLLDRDGDGFSALLAGGDCDDTNPNVGPGAKEIPGNGIDDNCVGGDAPLEDVATPPKPVAKPVAPDAPPVPTYEPQRYSVLVLLIDTLRPDHLGMYGYERPTSPNLDAFAKDAVVFENAFAHAPNTPRSIPSILTGRYPSRIKWKKRFDNYGSLLPENELMGEVFQAGGWRTEVVSSHWYFEKVTGIKDGIDTWDNSGFTTIKESNTQSAAPDITPRLVKRLEALKEGADPFFIMAHYFEPHGKYLNQKTAKVFGKGLMDKYDSEISFVDMHLKPVFDTLENTGLLDRTIVVVISDHGEAFKEHGFYFHGRTVYSEEIRVPLIVRMPKVAGKRVTTPVALVDVLPTLAEATGLEAKQALGVSLIPHITGFGEVPAKRVFFLEQLPYPNYEEHIVAAVDQDGQRVIRNLTKNVIETFAPTDRGDTTNLREADPTAGDALLKTLNQFIDGDPG